MRKTAVLLVLAVGLCLVGYSNAYALTLNFYSGTDLWLSSSGAQDPGNVNLGWGKNPGVTGKKYDSLIKFTDIFGSDPASQIPLGSVINSANLYMWVGYDSGRQSAIHQMTFDWNAASTWNSIGSTGGIVPGVNAVLTPELTWTGISNAWSQRTFDLTGSVQDWSDGAGNYGWGFTRARDAAVTACSLNYATPSYRPYLSVDFTPVAAAPEPASLLLFSLGGGALAFMKRKRA
ncbi:MAG: DNRLRE domain-containing protein [Candidatus Omnitrophica bacterium]|nr:DNRLRE domain-containing protein [Candidatus Omnitrophota bacterium]